MNHPIVELLLGRPRRRTLAVIGTAGRGEDGPRLTGEHWLQMLMVVRKVIDLENATDLVSGGAAWADYSVAMYTDEMPVQLYLPEYEKDLRTAEWYHDKFNVVLNQDGRLSQYHTWKEVLALPNNIYHKGFKDRNSKVAGAADVFLAMTFGEGAKVKDGGTADTVAKMLKRGIPGYHFDLNNFTLHAIQ